MRGAAPAPDGRGGARVLSVVAAGRRVADPEDALGQEARERLPAASGLSAEGVELALRRHLEGSIAPEELRALRARAGSAARCHVVLSANVCTAALRAIAFAAATAPALFVKPSRRDPVVAELLARALAGSEAFGAAGGSIALVPAISPAPGDEVHVYGGDATIDAIRGALPEGVALRAHGTGFGVAIAEAGADLEELARGLEGAVVPFDQRGCLSPRVLLVEGGADRALEVAEVAARCLEGAEVRVPRGALDGEARAEIARYVATAAAVGAAFEGPGYAVGADVDPRGLVLPPAARVVHVVKVDAAAAVRLLAPWREKVTTVGTVSGRTDGEVSLAVRRALPEGVRFVRLADMQRPPLDGPVDLRRVTRG